MRNGARWNTTGRTGTEAAALRRRGINLIMLGAFALVASGAASVVSNADLPMDVLMGVGVVVCLAGWRTMVVARHREQRARPQP